MSSNEREGVARDSDDGSVSSTSFITLNGGRIGIRWRALGSFFIRSFVLGTFAAMIHVTVRYVNAAYDAVQWANSRIDATLAALAEVPMFRLAAQASIEALPDNAFAFVAALVVAFAAMWVLDRFTEVL